jgi:hypothetical protein
MMSQASRRKNCTGSKKRWVSPLRRRLRRAKAAQQYPKGAMRPSGIWVSWS